jgi:hypothetical protein
MELDAVVAIDGHSPLGADCRFWTDAGRGYHMVGTVQASVLTGGATYFCTDGLTVWEMGGRLGSGFFELDELSRPAPWHLRELGLAPK